MVESVNTGWKKGIFRLGALFPTHFMMKVLPIQILPAHYLDLIYLILQLTYPTIYTKPYKQWRQCPYRGKHTLKPESFVVRDRSLLMAGGIGFKSRGASNNFWAYEHRAGHRIPNLLSSLFGLRSFAAFTFYKVCQSKMQPSSCACSKIRGFGIRCTAQCEADRLRQNITHITTKDSGFRVSLPLLHGSNLLPGKKHYGPF